jgi:hypothetical protein
VLSTVNLITQGKPGVAVVTESFAELARRLAEHNRMPDLPVIVLPYPLEDEPEDYVRQVARRAYPELLDKIGVVR